MIGEGHFADTKWRGRISGFWVSPYPVISRTLKSSRSSRIFDTFISGRLMVASRFTKRTLDRACLALVFCFWSACVYLRMWFSCVSVRASCFCTFCLFLAWHPRFLAFPPPTVVFSSVLRWVHLSRFILPPRC